MGKDRKSVISKGRIGFIGAGNMAQALISGMMKSKISPQKINRASNLRKIVDRCSILVIAVKPQNISDLIQKIFPFTTKNHLIISIAAGIETVFLKKLG